MSQLNSLESSIAEYKTAWQAILDSKMANTELAVLDLLIARDHVAHIVEEVPMLATTDVIQLATLDCEVKKAAAQITSLVGQHSFMNWREAIQPREEAWWWSLDQRAANEKSLQPWVSITAWITIGLSITYIVEIARRFIGLGTDAISTVLQGGLGLLVTGTVIQAVRQWIEGTPVPNGKRTSSKEPTVRLTLAAGLIVVAVSLCSSVRPIATYYNASGLNKEAQHQVSAAIHDYLRAIRLDPGFAEAHYNLANAYETTMNFDKAMEEYWLAIYGDPQKGTVIQKDVKFAYLNLARLYIIFRKDFRTARQLLDEGFRVQVQLNPEDYKDVQYKLYRNRGWANLGLKLFQQAEEDLRNALRLRPHGPAARYLLARALEEQQQIPQAMEAYRRFLTDAYREEDALQPEWVSNAQERYQVYQDRGQK